MPENPIEIVKEYLRGNTMYGDRMIGAREVTDEELDAALAQVEQGEPLRDGRTEGASLDGAR